MLFVPNPVRPTTPNITELEFFDIPETKSEESEEIPNTNHKSFQTIIIENIQNPTFNLTQEQIQWSQELLEKCPEIIEEIHNNIQIILSNEGQVDFHKIPAMIKIISEIIHHRAIVSELLHPENILTFIKYILYLIVEYDYFIPTYVDKMTIEILIEGSLDLLAYPIILPTIKEVKELDSCCFSIFSFFSNLFTPFFMSNTKKTN